MGSKRSRSLDTLLLGLSLLYDVKDREDTTGSDKNNLGRSITIGSEVIDPKWQNGTCWYLFEFVKPIEDDWNRIKYHQIEKLKWQINL